MTDARGLAALFERLERAQSGNRNTEGLLREAAAALRSVRAGAVPREPTPEMLKAAYHIYNEHMTCNNIWVAMYDAAPRSAPSTGPQPSMLTVAEVESLRRNAEIWATISSAKQAINVHAKEIIALCDFWLAAQPLTPATPPAVNEPRKEIGGPKGPVDGPAGTLTSVAGEDKP